MSESKISIPKDRIINLMLFTIPGEIYGQSIWERAEDDILRDCDFYESAVKAYHRHGTPKQQWQVGSADSPASESDLNAIEMEIKRMDSKTDFATTHDVNINPLDTTGIAGLSDFSNVSLQRTACALGVPEEMLGLGRGSTEATATVRMAAFLDKISTIQEIVSRTYSRLLIDRITGMPGKVWLEFEDVNTNEWYKLVQAVAALRTGLDPDAVLPAKVAREWLNIPEDDLDFPDSHEGVETYQPEGESPTEGHGEVL